MEVIKGRSGSTYEPRYSYSRIVQAGEWIFMSNTSARDFSTGNMPAGALAQATQLYQNISRALEAVGSSPRDIVRLRMHIPSRDDVDVIMEYFGEKLRGIDPTLTLICTPLLLDEYCVEAEVTAYKGLSSLEEKRIPIDL